MIFYRPPVDIIKLVGQYIEDLGLVAQAVFAKVGQFFISLELFVNNGLVAPGPLEFNDKVIGHWSYALTGNPYIGIRPIAVKDLGIVDFHLVAGKAVYEAQNDVYEPGLVIDVIDAFRVNIPVFWAFYGLVALMGDPVKGISAMEPAKTV